MKKSLITLTIMLAAVAMVAAFSCPALAAVTGPCVNCHTMHNSQGGTPMTLSDETEPLSALLRGTCMGCHTTIGSDPLADPGNTGGLYPFVYSSSGFDDNNCLAGGFFTDDTDPSDNNSNNQHSLNTKNLPAGYASNEELGDWYTGDTEVDGFACAGSNGCHGSHNVADDMAAISGGHHSPSAYRMLYVSLDNSEGVLGDGATDYEKAMIESPDLGDEHNTYSAEWSDPSISRFCAICHGNFHNETGTTTDCGAASPWLRHPTDVEIPSGWTIGNESNALTASDYKNNPVGYDNVDDNGQRMVTCLSCHRAHGTENNDLLRWAYSTQLAGQPTGSEVTYGCLGCHDGQR